MLNAFLPEHLLVLLVLVMPTLIRVKNEVRTIYNTGTRAGLMQELADMRKHLEPDETELLALTDSVLAKLAALTDEAYAEIELIPDFD